MPSFLGAVFSGIGGLVSGLFGNKSDSTFNPSAVGSRSAVSLAFEAVKRLV